MTIAVSFASESGKERTPETFSSPESGMATVSFFIEKLHVLGRLNQSSERDMSDAGNFSISPGSTQ
jgi:hypothetical protein